MEPEKFTKPNGAEVHPPEPIEEMVLLGAATVRCSRELGALCEALAKAQMEFGAVRKAMENPAYARGAKKSKYADLAAVIDATRPALAKNGLVVIQMPQVNHAAKLLTLTTKLLHASGQWIESDLTVPATQMNNRYDVQSIGSAMTYTRRYAWQSIVGVTAEEDDDGNQASGVGSAEAAQDVARKQLEEKAQSPDPKIRAIAQDGLNAIRAKEQAKAPSLEGALKQSIAAVPKAHIPLEESLESAKNDGMFDEIGGVIQQVREMVTTPANGSKPYRRIALAVVNKADGEMKDIELVSWDNLLLSDGKLWDYLENVTDSPAVFLCEVSEYKGKPSYTVRDVKAIGMHSWDARVGAIQQGAR